MWLHAKKKAKSFFESIDIQSNDSLAHNWRLSNVIKYLINLHYSEKINVEMLIVLFRDNPN